MEQVELTSGVAQRPVPTRLAELLTQARFHRFGRQRSVSTLAANSLALAPIRNPKTWVFIPQHLNHLESLQATFSQLLVLLSVPRGNRLPGSVQQRLDRLTNFWSLGHSFRLHALLVHVPVCRHFEVQDIIGGGWSHLVFSLPEHAAALPKPLPSVVVWSPTTPEKDCAWKDILAQETHSHCRIEVYVEVSTLIVMVRKGNLLHIKGISFHIHG
mmetsp:Transcript_49370/g.116034  ORF Transcript_49370/g.116034 Transcript_49370/m.116034 type:complete len:214 (-) Transcript_49370:250-891(-)